jgi:SpoVK/Ycf46/Vps4 family AAA+-type ATPase
MPSDAIEAVPVFNVNQAPAIVLHFQDVVLPDDQKSLIKETVENFAAYKKVRKALAQGGSSGIRFMGDPNLLKPRVVHVWTGVRQMVVQGRLRWLALAATGGGGNGLCLLFHGPSGVGKTMMANACASHVKKKVNVDRLGVVAVSISRILLTLPYQLA